MCCPWPGFYTTDSTTKYGSSVQPDQPVFRSWPTGIHKQHLPLHQSGKNTAAECFTSRRVGRCSFGQQLWRWHRLDNYLRTGKWKHWLVSWAAFINDSSRPAVCPQHDGQFDWLEPWPSQRCHPRAAVVRNDAGSHWLFCWKEYIGTLVWGRLEGTLTFVASFPHPIR